MKYDVTVIGAGVIGSMIARELTKYSLSVCFVERENDVACGASKANSGIVHGGFDPEPDTLKAKLNSEGVEKLFKTAEELNVPCIRNGSFVCAFSKEERGALEKLLERGKANGINGLSVISGEEARKLEPRLSSEVDSVLSVTNSGIVCPYELTIAAAGNAIKNGAALKLNFEVSSINKTDDGFEVVSAEGEKINTKYIFNCAGTFSDRIARLVGDDSFEIIPRIGEYILLDKKEGRGVTRTLFQVPTKAGKGILVSPTVDGNLLTGPTASEISDPDLTETTFEGLDAVKRLAVKTVPSVNFRSTITSFAGVRSSVAGGDFIIKGSDVAKGFINVAAIDSPGLTSSVAIAEYAVDILKEICGGLLENPDFDPTRPDPHFFKKMTDEEKSEFIKNHSDYGRIVCRCETVTEGEIRAAIRQEPHPSDLDGVKRRTRSGMGRCQGGFCSPVVMKLIAEELCASRKEVTKCGKGSNILTGELV